MDSLSKVVIKSKKRIGRGYGSGKGGHTSSRGSKGQKSRGSVSTMFEGTKMKKSLLKRLPLLRGRGKFKPSEKDQIIVNIKYLNLLPAGSEVTIETLVKYNIVNEKDARECGVKILGEGELKNPLTVRFPISKGARAKVEKAGGKIEMLKATPVEKLKLAPKQPKKK